MLDRAYRISSDWSYFSQECDRLQTVFLNLKYPRHLFNLAVNQFVDSKVAARQQIPSTDTTPAPIRVVIPFKDQVSANIVKKRLTDLSLKSRPLFSSWFSLCSSAENSTKTLNFDKSSQPLLTNNVYFINSNVACAMQDMLVILAATFTKDSLMDTNRNRRQFVNIILANITRTYHQCRSQTKRPTEAGGSC